MVILEVFARDIPGIEAALAQRRVEGVKIGSAFLGRVIIQCPDTAAADVVAHAGETRQAA